MIADELRRQADEFIDLVHLATKVGRDPSERIQRYQERRAPGAVAGAPVGVPEGQEDI